MASNKIIAIKITLSVLLLVCLFDMPYGYYQFVRFIGMISFGLLAFEKNQTWFVIWISSAILINPFLKIALGRDIWNIIDVIWVILLVVSMILNKRDVG